MTRIRLFVENRRTIGERMLFYLIDEGKKIIHDRGVIIAKNNEDSCVNEIEREYRYTHGKKRIQRMIENEGYSACTYCMQEYNRE